MKIVPALILVLLSGLCRAVPPTVTLSTSMFQTHQRLFLAPLDGWLFHAGTNPAWASPTLNTMDWKVMKPQELSPALADASGRVEGWFRLKIKLDSSFRGLPLGLNRELWAATEVYVDGRLVQAFGHTGRPYRAYNPILKYPIPLSLTPGKEHLLALHVVDYETTFTQREIRLKPQNLHRFINLTGSQYRERVTEEIKLTHIYATLCISVSFLLFFLFWLLVVLNPGQTVFKLIALLTTLVLFSAVGSFCNTFFESSYPLEKLRFVVTVTSQIVMTTGALLVLEWVLTRTISRLALTLLALVTMTSTAAHLFTISAPFGIALTGMLAYFGYLLVRHWSRISGAQWAVVAATVVPTMAAMVYINLHKYSLDLFNEYDKPITSLLILSSPLLLMVYISFRFREILAEVSEKAQRVLNVTREKNELIASQNEVLEKQVTQRTTELRQSLDELKTTQTQLIQKEKMASLGELTAGIAHEIQNPLNFVTNFSEVSTELVEELMGELDKGDPDEARAIAGDLSQNLQKITLHGQRASSIVKGMLEHSRTSTGEKQPTDLNALTEEYLRLAYHGFRAKDTAFQATLNTNFEPDLPKIEVIPQDLGRVLLNLFNNAFYAVSEKQKLALNGYQPTINLSTRREKGQVEIRVNDNGVGIPETVTSKIFQPFFTTKPTGQGTGLGLSLSYDIVTKGHGGALTVVSEVGTFTEVRLTLPTPHRS